MFFLGEGGASLSFLVKSKCMARGSLKKKKRNKQNKKNSYKNLFSFSRTFAMAAHIFQSHGDEKKSLSENIVGKKQKKKKMRMDESYLSSLTVSHYYSVFPSFFFIPSP